MLRPTRVSGGPPGLDASTYRDAIPRGSTEMQVTDMLESLQVDALDRIVCQKIVTESHISGGGSGRDTTYLRTNVRRPGKVSAMAATSSKLLRRFLDRSRLVTPARISGPDGG